MLDLAQYDLALLAFEERRELLDILAFKDKKWRGEWLKHYEPYPRQQDFHAAGKTFRERLFMAGNQSGKTLAGAAEVAMHLTGDYPAWWVGRRWDHATRWIAGSESAELTRKGVQRLLLGAPEVRDDWGTGAIPKASIVGYSMRAGVADAVASVVVKHKSGDNSVVQFSSYDQGRTKWQADTLDGVWFDEEPPEPVYFEGLTRTNATSGMVMMTFTPLFGMSKVVVRYLEEKPPGSNVTRMTIYDALHYSKEQADAIAATYPLHEREARAMGEPILGSGRVFPVAESVIKCEPFPIPAHWPRICGLDFGWDHPAAVAWLAWDRDTDTLYVYECWKARETLVAQQALVIRARGEWIPVAWPHDGLQHDKGSGDTLSKQYKTERVAMLRDRATFEDGKSFGLEAGVLQMLDRLQSRRLQVFNHLNDWFSEFRMYYRKDGIIVKLRDDLMSATRYAMMMRRKALTEHEGLVSIGHPGARRLIPGFGVLDPVAGY